MTSFAAQLRARAKAIDDEFMREAADPLPPEKTMQEEPQDVDMIYAVYKRTTDGSINKKVLFNVTLDDARSFVALDQNKPQVIKDKVVFYDIVRDGGPEVNPFYNQWPPFTKED